MTTPTLQSGDGAYWDSFSGLVPVKVLAVRGVSGPPSSQAKVDFEVTADHKPYRKGERFEDVWSLHVVPRRAVHRRQYSTTIRFYHVLTDTRKAEADAIRRGAGQ